MTDVPKFDVTPRCSPPEGAGKADYTPRPTGKPVDPDAAFQRVMARYPRIMKRLAE